MVTSYMVEEAGCVVSTPAGDVGAGDDAAGEGAAGEDAAGDDAI